jgi:hypothetical protein
MRRYWLLTEIRDFQRIIQPEGSQQSATGLYPTVHPTSLRCILILPSRLCLRFANYLFPLPFTVQDPPIHSIRPAHRILLDLVTLMKPTRPARCHNPKDNNQEFACDVTT